MKNIKLEFDEKICIIRLARSVTNPLNLALLKELSKNLQKLHDDSSIRGIILTGDNDKFFSIGFDIPELYHQSKSQVTLFYKTFNRLSIDLYTFPKPIINAITGHAIAGGCILSICCDYRFIADERKLMGLNEIKLGIPVPYPADCILRQLVGDRTGREIMYTGDFYKPEESLKMGLVDTVLPIDQVLPKAIEKAKLIGEMPPEAFSMIKQNRVKTVKEHILSKLKEKEEYFIKSWHSKPVRKLLEEAIKKF